MSRYECKYCRFRLRRLDRIRRRRSKNQPADPLEELLTEIYFTLAVYLVAGVIIYLVWRWIF